MQSTCKAWLKALQLKHCKATQREKSSQVEPSESCARGVKLIRDHWVPCEGEVTAQLVAPASPQTLHKTLRACANAGHDEAHRLLVNKAVCQDLCLKAKEEIAETAEKPTL